MHVGTIARTLGISVHTARSHVKKILAKTGCHSQLEVVVEAASRGWLRAPSSRVDAMQADDNAREAAERLDEIDRVRKTFVSQVSHELRTPLTSIMGFLEVLRDMTAPLDDQQSGIVDIIERNASRLLALIEDLLMVSGIESRMLATRHDVVRVAEIVERACAHVAATQDGASRISVKIQPGDVCVAGDGNQLQRAVGSVLANALKFAPDGSAIDLVAREEGGEVVVTVTDQGPGVEVKDRDAIFEPFFRTRTADRLAIPGSGLGLAITRAIVQEHAGSIACVPSAGAGTGTTIEIRLPQTEPTA
jgi:signal transduction histidine kinase